MPPSASDPKDLRLVLNPARRKAFTLLVGSIVGQMRKNVEYTFEPTNTSPTAPLFTSPNPRDQSSFPSNVDSSEAARQKRLEARLEQSLSTAKMDLLKRDALRYFDKWTEEVRVGLRKITDGPDEPRAAERRREWLANKNQAPPPYTPSPGMIKTLEEEAAQAAEARDIQEAKDISMFQSLYTPTPTRFTTISKEDRICVISCMILLLLSLGHYSAHSRALLCYLTSSFALPMSTLTDEETEISKTLLLASKALNADAETQKRAAANASSRRWKVGLSAVAGAALIGVTGGLAAPVVAGAIGGLMGGVGLGGVASFLGIFAMNGALVGTLFGAFGAKMTGEMVDAYAKEVQDFNFIPIASEWGEHTSQPKTDDGNRRLRVAIGINGWLNEKEDIVRPWRALGRDSEVFALRYEMEALLELGNSLKDMVSSYAWSYIKLEILKRTVLATLWAALWPVYLIKMATALDTPFAVAKNRSEKAGEVLADALINKAQGERPVTLIGYSLGARVIYSCLKSLVARRAFGIVENVILIGAPIPSNSVYWREMRSVVSGKLVNVYSENDYILAFLYRATSIQYGVAGLQKIEGVEGVNNEDLSKDVSGHLRYPELVGKILRRVGVEHVDVTDETIEVDPEIKVVDNEDLIDFGDEGGAAKLSDGDFRVMENHDTWPDRPRPSTDSKGKNTVILEMDDTSSSSTAMPSLTSSMSDTSLVPKPTPGPSTVGRKPLPTSPNSAPMVQQTTTREIPLLSSTSTYTSNTTLSSPPGSGPSTSHFPGHTAKAPNIPKVEPEHDPEPDGYSSDDAGGIQMLDNDSGGELELVDSEPIPDDDYYPSAASSSRTRGGTGMNEDSRDKEKMSFEEQKSLGGFPR
ncbi:hypothetical protein BJ875DRAFT_284301 [Amylocarpus encephaloides]|uniref:DUF726-domain-containing protein n=1 Tax=Amylocarpus encephaloides TaxID=45428 RepID=A0A9P7YK77_9HELO|nr:hypothetical protein BJ875DRAFT_284301 [Amylocarpus encephaloides]